MSIFVSPSNPSPVGRVTALLCRHVVCDAEGKSCSLKKPVAPRAFLGRHGIEGTDGKEHYDDTENALLQYAGDHYPYWRKFLPVCTSLLQNPGAFSENIASLGMTEHTVCIGDIFRIGTAIVQVSFGREACHTMNERFGRDDMAREMHRLSYNGWFYRVLEEGFAQAGDTVFLMERPQPEWTVARVQRYLFGKSMERPILETLSQLPELSPVWRNLFLKRLETGHPEDTGY